MRYIVLVILSIAIWQSGMGQITFSGVVKDSATSAPLSSAYIEINDNSIVTNESGEFSIFNLQKGIVSLKVWHVGCNAVVKHLNLQKDTHLVILLRHHVHAFDEVVAISSRSQSSINVSQTVNSKELTSRGLTTLGEALTQQTGITSIQTGNAVYKPVVQGMHSSRLSIINDDSKQEGQQWGIEHGPEIDPMSYGNIEVIKGASSLRYGNDAIGGVLVLHPAKFRDTSYKSLTLISQLLSNPVGGSLISKFESYNDVKQFGTRISLSAKKTGDAYSPRYVLSNTSFSQLSSSYYAVKNFKKGSLSFKGDVFLQKFGILASSHIGNLTDLERAIESDTPLIIRPYSFNPERPYQTINHYSGKLKYTLDDNKFGKLTLSYTIQQNIRKEFDRHSKDENAALNLNLNTNQLVLNHLKQIDGWKLQSGLSSEYQSNTYQGRYFIPNYHRFKGGGYFITSRTWTTLTIEGGIRYDAQFSSTFRPELGKVINDRFTFNGLSSNLGGRWSVNEDLRLFLNTSTRFRSPEINEFFSDGLHHGSAAIEVGDINLKEERSYSLNVGMYYNHNRWRIIVEPYLHYFNNYIYLKPKGISQLSIRGAFPVFEHTQTNARYLGMDVDIKYHLNSKWELEVDASLLNVQDITNRKYIFGIPPISLRSRLEYSTVSTNSFNKLNIALSPTYTFTQFWVEPNEDFAEPPEGYFLLNLLCQGEFKKMPATLTLSITNALNNSYRNYLNRYRYFAHEQGFQTTLTFNYTIF